jgi:hypothetical protein
MKNVAKEEKVTGTGSNFPKNMLGAKKENYISII